MNRAKLGNKQINKFILYINIILLYFFRMTYVQKKTSDDICVYQTIEDEIIYAQEIFENNYIST